MKMNRIARSCFVLAVSLAALCPSVLPGIEAPPGTELISGTIQSAKEKAYPGTIKTSSGEYFIVADEKGRDLIKSMKGDVSLFCVVTEKEGRKWIKIVEYAGTEAAAAHELWRRMRCNACVILPAIINATEPDDLAGAEPVTGRFHTYAQELWAWTRDAKSLWAATTEELFQIDLDRRQVARVYGKKDGLPDHPIYQLVSDGTTLWIVHRGGIATLRQKDGAFRAVPGLKPAFARAYLDGSAVWIIADTGTFRFKSPDGEPEVFPAIPTSAQIARLVARGIWLPYWSRKTSHFVTDPARIGDSLFAGSYGDIYELAGGKWTKIAQESWVLNPTITYVGNRHPEPPPAIEAGATQNLEGRTWEMSTKADRLWYATPAGLVEYDPAGGKRVTHAPPDLPRGKLRCLLVTGSAVWVAVDPVENAEANVTSGGGLARFDLAGRKWQSWNEINGHKSDRVGCLKEAEDAVWAVTMTGVYETKGAHPGMTYVKSRTFSATDFCLHRFNEKGGTWLSVPLKIGEVEKRLICGHEGNRATDAVVPQFVDDVCPGPSRMFAVLRLLPRKFFSGYWPCIDQIAARKDAGADWAPEFAHHPEQLNLQGEQPAVLNIANRGDIIAEAVGHDNVLGLFLRDGAHWAVTEGCVAWFDEQTKEWKKVFDARFNFYWRATCALDDGRFLYIGSDRGLVSRLDIDAGSFEPQVFLKDRAIAGIYKDEQGRIVAASRDAPLGILPSRLPGAIPVIDADAAWFDGKNWSGMPAGGAPPGAPEWKFAQVKGKRDRFDKSRGNYLIAARSSKPSYYVKEVFFPEYLCSGLDGGRIWISTFSGLLRLDLARKEQR